MVQEYLYSSRSELGAVGGGLVNWEAASLACLTWNKEFQSQGILEVVSSISSLSGEETEGLERRSVSC